MTHRADLPNISRILDPLPIWLIDPRIRKFMALFNDTDSDPQALFVGGCVRHAVLGLDVTDIDVATILPPQEVMERAQNAGLKVIPTGLDHGTVTIICDGLHFEVTTLRRDEDTDGRHAQVSFSKSWVEDAKRRDFTMNTLLMDEKGGVYDPLGTGVSDLLAGRVVFVGQADKRIEEDYLRILRFFRFFAGYGQGDADAAALQACCDSCARLADLSVERVTQEITKMLMMDVPAHALDMMFGAGVLSDLSILKGCEVIDRLAHVQREWGAEILSTRLYALMECDLSHRAVFERWLRLSNATWKRVVALDCALAGANNVFRQSGIRDVSDEALRLLIYKYGKDSIVQVLSLYYGNDAYDCGDIYKLKQRLDGVCVPVFLLNGQDMKVRGIAQGPDIGRELRRLEQLWISAGFDDSVL